MYAWEAYGWIQGILKFENGSNLCMGKVGKEKKNVLLVRVFCPFFVKKKFVKTYQHGI
jgi:hypothetical protein